MKKSLQHRIILESIDTHSLDYKYRKQAEKKKKKKILKSSNRD